MSMMFLTSDPSILQVWTDGAINVHSQKKPGGWASVFVHEKALVEVVWNGVVGTTSQRMELTAALEAMKIIYETFHERGDRFNHKLNTKIEAEIKEIEILSDSQYLITCLVAKWHINWVANNWISLIDGQPIKNRDLWEDILSYKDKLEDLGYKLSWRKVKGHKGLIYNEVADKYAVRGKMSVS